MKKLKPLPPGVYTGRVETVTCHRDGSMTLTYQLCKAPRKSKIRIRIKPR